MSVILPVLVIIAFVAALNIWDWKRRAQMTRQEKQREDEDVKNDLRIW